MPDIIDHASEGEEGEYRQERYDYTEHDGFHRDVLVSPEILRFALDGIVAALGWALELPHSQPHSRLDDPERLDDPDYSGCRDASDSDMPGVILEYLVR